MLTKAERSEEVAETLQRSILRTAVSEKSSSIRPPKPKISWGEVTEFFVETEHKAPEAPPVLELVPRAKQQRACDILQTWSMPTTPSPSGKRPRATWSLDEPILKYALRHADSSSPAPVVERQQAPSPPAKRVRATRPDGSPLLPEGWREEVRIPASGREYRVYIGPEAGQMADSRVKAWEAFERAKQGLPIRGMVARDSDGTGSKRKGVAGRPRVCLACDLGRKRRCTCGQKQRRW